MTCNCFVPGKEAKYCDQRVCMSVCTSVRWRISKKRMTKVHEIFRTCCVSMAVARTLYDENAICYVLPVF